MSTIGNILWFLIVGLWASLILFVIGALWCVTIIGIPVGVQCFKIAGFTAFPFGRTVVYGGQTVSLLLNILWIIFTGLETALALLSVGVALCVTIIGIPFGLQCFKIAKLCLMPFGAEIVGSRTF